MHIQENTVWLGLLAFLAAASLLFAASSIFAIASA
jgi:hypothetical protein